MQVTEPANSKRTGVLQAAVKPIYGTVRILVSTCLNVSLLMCLT